MIAIKEIEMPKGCQHCKCFRKRLFGNGLDYSYSCMLGATEFPMPWIRQQEERASDCPLVEIKEAEWTHWTDDFRDYVKCSNCGFGDEGEIYLGDEPVICPCCEAKMKGGHNG